MLASVLLLFPAFGTASLLHFLAVLPFQLPFFLSVRSLSCLAFSSSLKCMTKAVIFSSASFLKQLHPLVTLAPLNPKVSFPQIVLSFTIPVFMAACFQESKSVAAEEPVSWIIF